MDIFGEAFRSALAILLTGANGVYGIIALSLQVSGSATIIASLIGLPVGAWLGTSRFLGRRWALTVVNTGMALPPVVVGLFVFMLLSRNGPLGQLQLLYSVPAMVMAQVIIAVPLVVGVSAAAVAQVPRELLLQARSLGASRVAEMWLALKEARWGVLAAVVAGFGGAISEVGAVMMVGGNLAGDTRVMTTFIMMETRKGEYGTAFALGIILVGLAFAINAVLTAVQSSGGRYGR
jgi:tungstate transport system permease protein